MSWFDPWEEIEAVALCDDPVERAIAHPAPAVRSLLDAALAGRELSVADGETLLRVSGDDLVAWSAADAVRRRRRRRGHLRRQP